MLEWQAAVDQGQGKARRKTASSEFQTTYNASRENNTPHSARQPIIIVTDVERVLDISHHGFQLCASVFCCSSMYKTFITLAAH